MKQQVSRLSPHQNGKVFGVLMAVASLVIALPIALLVSVFGPPGGPSIFMMLLLPVFYLVFGYLSVVIGCALYT